MKKIGIKIFIDILMFLDFLAVAFSGFVLWFVLPRGSGKFGASFIFLRENWLSIHNIGSVILTLLLLLHLILNWSWIKCFIFKSLNKNDRK